MAAGVSLDGPERIFEDGWLTEKGKALDVHINTEDLVLCSVGEADKANYLALYSDPDTMKMFTDNEARLSFMELDAWKQEKMKNIAKRIDIWIQRWKDGIPFSAFAIYHKNGDFVGHVVAGFGDNPGESEVAYIIRHQDWNKGFGSQAVEAIVQKWMPYLRQKGYEVADDDGISKRLSFIVATSRFDNDPSNRILVKNGFTVTGEKEAWGYKRYVYKKYL